jgi:ATP phosphoribosyltransferase regulatory subunit
LLFMIEHLSRIPGGMRYYVGADARLRKAVETCASSVFEGWSYEDISTPAVDYFALFEQVMGSEAHRAFRFTDTDGRMLALRPDITSSVARAAATLLTERPRPLRLCYAAPVFRQRPLSHAEWRRQTTQLGCELIGIGGKVADMEVLSIAAEVCERLGLKDNFCITINHAEVFNGIAENLELDEVSREQMRTLIDSRDATELERFLQGCATTSEERGIFSRLTQLAGKSEVLDEARRVITNPRSVAAIDALEGLWKLVESLGLDESFEIDLGDVAGLDYYTGLVFKIFVRGAGTRVGRGGRYDDLIGNFGRPEPAIGFILDLDALTDVLANSNNLELAREGEKATALIAAVDDLLLFQEAKERRSNGERVKVQFAEWRRRQEEE